MPNLANSLADSYATGMRASLVVVCHDGLQLLKRLRLVQRLRVAVVRAGPIHHVVLLGPPSARARLPLCRGGAVGGGAALRAVLRQQVHRQRAGREGA